MSELSVLAICCTTAFSVYWIGAIAADMFMRWTRTRNIAAHGWPPKHLDADGDPVAWHDAESEEAA